MEKETMIGIKKLTALFILALAMSLCAPQGYAGEILTPPAAGEMSTPSLNGNMDTPTADGTAESPGYKRDGWAESPGVMSDIDLPGLNGWIGTGLYAGIASLFI
jgi:hypothetical protein